MPNVVSLAVQRMKHSAARAVKAVRLVGLIDAAARETTPERQAPILAEAQRLYEELNASPQ